MAHRESSHRDAASCRRWVNDGTISSPSSPSSSPPFSTDLNVNLLNSLLDDESRTVLHYLCLADSIHYGRQLLEYVLVTWANEHADGETKVIRVESRDRNCLAPIHCAAQYGHVPVVECLLQHGADPNSKGFRGTTPLHITAYNNHEKAAMTLIQYGADVTRINEDELTPAEVAKKGSRLHSTPKSSPAKNVPPLDVNHERELDPLIEEIDLDDDLEYDECGAMADVIERLLGRESRMSQDDEDQEDESDLEQDDAADEEKTIVNDEEKTGDADADRRSGEELYVSRLGYRDADAVSVGSDTDDAIRWKKGHCLGKGSFGTVWRAMTDTGQLIAVKLLELPVDDAEFLQTEYGKVEDEVAILKELKHPNIVEFIGTSFDGCVLHIFMELVPGGSIAANLKQFGAFEEGVMRSYTKQILSGIVYLHDNNVVHRDIKGGNAMVMPSGVVKLIDFGCAKRLVMKLTGNEGDMLKSLRGTPFWMAPEVINETGYGKKSDVWSLGCTVYEMATTKPPWGEMDRFAALLAIGSGSDPVPQLLATFSTHAHDFVDTCLTRDQSLRPSARQLESHPFLTGDQHGSSGT